MTTKSAESTVIVDLEVNRSLLDPNFDCYRVSIDPMATYEQPFTGSVNELRLADEEYSYLHISMASQFNHLFNDPYFPQTVYFATNLGQIMWTSIEISGNLIKPKVVYSLPDFDSSFISISFPTIELSLISMSSTKSSVIYLMTTPSRGTSEPWILLSAIDLSAYKMQNKCHLWDTHSIDLFNNCLQIDFVLCFVDKSNQKEDPSETKQLTESSFICVLNWFTITGNVNESNSWSIKRQRTMNGKDWPKYVALDFIGSSLLCLVSKKDFKFVYDSDKPIEEQTFESITTSDPKPIYTYCQTLEVICVTFKLPVHLTKNDISIDLKPNTIAVKIKDIIEFDGQLFDTIEANTSVWTLLSQQDFQLLEITVNKAEKGKIWKQLILGDKNGVEVINTEMIEEIYQKLNHLTQELPDLESDDINRYNYDPRGFEECDYTTDSLVFSRYNGNSHSITHRIDLTGSQWLFTIPAQKSSEVDSNELPYLVVRHDVDAIVCAPQSSPDINQLKATHLATFSAIGYVQASKTNTRFIVGSNDFSFVAIADGLRHIYIYRQPIDLRSEIRNRKTGQEVQRVAKQHVINLNDCQYIIGIHAINDHIFVLSNDKIFLIKL